MAWWCGRSVGGRCRFVSVPQPVRSSSCLSTASNSVEPAKVRGRPLSPNQVADSVRVAPGLTVLAISGLLVVPVALPATANTTPLSASRVAVQTESSAAAGYGGGQWQGEAPVPGSSPWPDLPGHVVWRELPSEGVAARCQLRCEAVVQEVGQLARRRRGDHRKTAANTGSRGSPSKAQETPLPGGATSGVVTTTETSANSREC